MSMDAMSFREADARFASKESVLELKEQLQSTKVEILNSIDRLRQDKNTAHDGFEVRLRFNETAVANNAARLTVLEAPKPVSSTSVVMQSVLSAVISTIIVAIAFGGLAAYFFSHQMVHGG
jgi:hypothetical protein